MNHEQRVDDALDQYIAHRRGRGIEPEGFRCVVLAQITGETTRTIGRWLQEYRRLQGRRETRYTIAATGYGRKGRWKILSKPGTDPRVVQQARVDQMTWCTHDISRRFTRDVLHEIRPGLQGTALDAAIDAVLPLVEHQLQGIVDHVDRTLGVEPAPV